MQSSFTNTLHTTRLIADGAMGTELQKRGLPVYTPADRWVLTHSDDVLAVHRAYVEAGSQVVLTNTLNANASTFTAEEATTINHKAVEVARQSGSAWVAGSVGPRGDETQIRALADSGVDALWLETQMNLADVERLIAICQRVTSLPIVVSFSFHRPDGLTHAGDTPQTIAETLTTPGVDALGANCGNGLDILPAILQSLRENTTLPLILKPNAGIPVVTNDVITYPLTAASWAAKMREILLPDVHLVGGCCGTTPAYIRELCA